MAPISHRSVIVAAVLGAALMTAAGCGEPLSSTKGVQVWAVSDARPVRPDDAAQRETDCYSHQTRRITLQAARNETVACQIVVTAGDKPLSGVTVSIGSLAGQGAQIPTSAVRAYQPLLVRTTRAPSWSLIRPDGRRGAAPRADALVPIDAPQGRRGIDVPAGASMPIWIDVAVGEKLPPGTYRGQVTVTSGGFPVDDVELQVEVLPFVLPSRPKTPLLVGVDMAAVFRHHLEHDGRPFVPAGVVSDGAMVEASRAVLDRTMRLLHDHRCSPFLTGVYPHVSLDAAGRMRVGWDTYDRTVSSYVDGSAFADRAKSAAWPMPADPSFPPAASYGGEHSPAYAEAFRTYHQQCVAHFREKGWLAGHFVWTGVPDPEKPDPPGLVKTFGARVRQADAGLKLMTTAIPQSMKPFGWLGHEFDPSIVDLVSIWAPPAAFCDAATMARQRALGRRTWMIPGRPPFSPSLSLCAPPVDPRAMAWQAFRYGMDGIVVPRANDWPDRPSASVMPADAAWLIWPGKPFGVAGPIPSIRLKRLRRGLQDVEYLRALKRLGDGEMADKIARALFHCGGSAAYEDHFADGCQWPWTADPELWDLARRLVADRIAQLKGQARPDENRRLARAVEWRRFVDGACKLRVYCEGVRVRSSDDASGGSADIEFYVVIRNDRLEVVTGQVRFGKLPVGWQPVAGDRPVKDLPSLGRARMSLVARATSIGTNDVGIAYVPIVFDAGPAGTVEILARLPQLTAMRLRQPVAIDGDLSDWPAGLRNVAGDFIEVAGQDPTLAGREPTGRARQQTLVFVGVDDRRLYFAFNCREDRLDALPTTSSNFVRYDGLLPAGDDLLEILIDPTNAGTGQPIDIYRVVIRPTGAAFAGRGVETQAGWGSRRHWPADVRVATSRQDRAWSAEVSIPLSAFGQAGRSGKRWAVNFARYQSRLGEYSSWSGARRYFYNTRSFGNLTRP